MLCLKLKEPLKKYLHFFTQNVQYVQIKKNKMIKYSTTDARKKFSDIINQVKYGKKIIAIGRNRNYTEALIVPYPKIDDQNIPISEINAQSASFDFLENEPDIYNISDLKKQYV